MPRMRTIKHGFFTSEQLADVSFDARLLFAGLWVLADRQGRLEDRPRKIKAELFPYEEVPVNSRLDDLQRVGLIVRYEVDGNRYIQITGFSKHQSPHPKEPTSVIPPVPEACKDDAEKINGEQVASPENSRQESDEPGKGEHEPSMYGYGNSNGNRSGGGNVAEPHAHAPPDGLIDSPVMAMYWQQFKVENLPAIPTQERAIVKVQDLSRWQEILNYWQDNNYRPESLGKMVDKYLEEIESEIDGAKTSEIGLGRGYV